MFPPSFDISERAESDFVEFSNLPCLEGERECECEMGGRVRVDDSEGDIEDEDDEELRGDVCCRCLRKSSASGRGR